ncbi:MAG: membrane protein insertion efficiency factor YidD [Planctomycetota bacterium]
MVVACLAFLGNGIEAGRARTLGLGRRSAAVGAALVAHLGAWAWLTDPALWATATRVAVLVVAGLTIPTWARRFDRGEAGWRAAVRQGPPDGRAPAALAIARRRLPLPLELSLALVGLPLRLACVGAIAGYQLTASRLMPPACRFEPTCSRYGFHAYLRHGVVRGSLLTGLRLVRCSPVSDGGYDPVPPRCAPEGAEVS